MSSKHLEGAVHIHRCPQCQLMGEPDRCTTDPFWRLCSKCKIICELKVAGPGQLPTRAYDTDCGFDLYTYCEQPTLQGELNTLTCRPDTEVFFKNEDKLCVIENYDHWRYRLAPGSYSLVDCGVAVEFPPGRWGWITGRSSVSLAKGVIINAGIIDEGFRGRLFIGIFNITHKWITVEPGERLGQLILMQNASANIVVVPVETLSPSPRGTKGFGSSGS